MLFRSYAVFMAMENIKCIQVSGNAHAWNKIYLNLDNGFKWYVVDPTWGNAESDEFETANHCEFLYDDKTKEDAHFKADNYLDAAAAEDINQFKYIKYDGTKDMFIENNEELTSYIQYIGPYVKELHDAGKDVCIEVVFPNSGSSAYSPSSSLVSSLFKNYCDWNVTSLSFSRNEFAGYTMYNYIYEA